ncbi:endonuclease III [Microvirga thermotolerans]|uniref:Endonuclease III n=1 Tax=Microvirga thermotolerans TaxID=2651334 RepID=A0A5P9K1L0_9HYPH|nr:endonuclease III [Microvirga thermotolerans]QFU17560.1 endonuclease III [Microvirga thermotolerans]
MSDLKRSPRRIPASAAKPAPPEAAAKAASGRAPRGRAPKPVDRATLVEVFRRLRDLNPEPKGELEYTNPYTLLVAVALSAQATDVGVNKATRNLFPVADTPQKMLALGEEGLRERIHTLNFFNTKAKNVIAFSKRLVEEFGGEVPNSIAILETFPGVGRKTASVVANIAFGDPRIAVDTHIFRVANRIPLVVTRTPLETQEALEAVVPDAFRLHAHHWLILHGRYLCKARRPECWRCPIADLCRYPEKTPAPVAGKRVSA